MPEKAKLLGKRVVHRGNIVDLEVHRIGFEDGVEVELEHVLHPGGAAVVAVDDQGRVALVEQHRHAVGAVLLELPAGKMKRGEEPIRCALRELEEETGVRTDRLETLGAVWTTPGFSDERIWLFYTESLLPGERNLDRDERLDVRWVPFEQALDWALSGRIEDAKSVCALVRAARLRK